MLAGNNTIRQARAQTDWNEGKGGADGRLTGDDRAPKNLGRPVELSVGSISVIHHPREWRGPAGAGRRTRGNGHIIRNGARPIRHGL